MTSDISAVLRKLLTTRSKLFEMFSAFGIDSIIQNTSAAISFVVGTKSDRVCRASCASNTKSPIATSPERAATCSSSSAGNS